MYRPSPSAIANSAWRPVSSIGSLRPSASSARASSRRQRIVVEPAQHQHLAARQERGVQLEGRVLGGGADQRHRAVLDIGQEAVLLGAIEAMDLVDEQQRALAVLAALAGGLEDPCAGRRRRKRPPTAARNAGPRPRRAGGRSWSFRSPAVPRGSASRACGRPASGPAALRARAGDPDRGFRPSVFGRRRSASGVGASEAKSSAGTTTRIFLRAQRNWTGKITPSRPTLMLLMPLATRFLRSATVFTSWPLTARIMSPGRTKRPA